jgi:hypothetical protein
MCILRHTTVALLLVFQVMLLFLGKLFDDAVYGLVKFPTMAPMLRRMLFHVGIVKTETLKYCCPRPRFFWWGCWGALGVGGVVVGGAM